MNIIDGNEPVINEATMSVSPAELSPKDKAIDDRNKLLCVLESLTHNRSCLLGSLSQLGMRKKTSIYIVIEGPDHVGKSTIIKEVMRRLPSCSIRGESICEPGGTKLGGLLRQVLKNEKLPPISQFNLMQVSRQSLLDEVILPNMRKGIATISDRNFISSIVYQGILGGCSEAIDISTKTAKNMCPTYTAWIVPSKEDYDAHLIAKGFKAGDVLERQYDPRTVRDTYQSLFGMSVIGCNDRIPELEVSSSNFSRRNRLFTHIDSEATAQQIISDIVTNILPAEEAAMVNLKAKYQDDLVSINAQIASYEKAIREIDV